MVVNNSHSATILQASYITMVIGVNSIFTFLTSPSQLNQELNIR